MHQRSKSVASGRPSGTDGSDFSYRMVVESRYQEVAKGKSRLSALIIFQAIIQMIGAVFTLLLTSGSEGLDMVAISSGAIGFFSLILGDLGRRRSWVSLLRAYLLGSTVATFISIVCVLRGNLSLEVIKNSSKWEAMKIELLEATRILIGFFIQIYVISNVRSEICLLPKEPRDQLSDLEITFHIILKEQLLSFLFFFRIIAPLILNSVD